MQRSLLFLPLLLLMFATAGRAQVADVPTQPATPEVPTGMILQFNPLGFLQFGPHLEAELPIAEGMAVTGGVRITSLGLLPHLLVERGETINFGFTVGGALHTYPQRTGLAGLFFGPRVEVGMSSTTDALDDYTAIVGVGGAEVGYRWIFPSGFNMAVGFQSGAAIDSWRGANTSQTGSDVYFFGTAMLTIGLTM